MKILVAYGSERGGTQGIAEWIAATLRADGAEVEICSADRVRDVRSYDAVVLGGALYGFRWHKHARRFVLRHAKALREREVYFFSSGPLDDSASRDEIPPLQQVKELMEHLGARGHATFGGRLASDAAGFPASAMAKTSAGDWRDRAAIETWAREIAAALRAPRPPRGATRPLPSRTLPLALSFAAGIATLAFATRLAMEPGDRLEAVGLAMLVAAPLLGAAWLHFVRSELAAVVSLLAGVSLVLASVSAVVGDATALGIAALVVALAVIAEASLRMLRTVREMRDAWARLPKAGREPAPDGSRA